MVGVTDTTEAEHIDRKARLRRVASSVLGSACAPRIHVIVVGFEPRTALAASAEARHCVRETFFGQGGHLIATRLVEKFLDLLLANRELAES